MPVCDSHLKESMAEENRKNAIAGRLSSGMRRPVAIYPLVDGLDSTEPNSLSSSVTIRILPSGCKGNTAPVFCVTTVIDLPLFASFAW